MMYEDWLRTGRGKRAAMAVGASPRQAALQEMQEEPFDPYNLQPHEREQWLSQQQAGWRRMMGSSPKEQALSELGRPSMEEVSKTEGWYDQPEWVRRKMLETMGYGSGG